MHWLLQKQLNQLGIDLSGPLSAEARARLLAQISETYGQSDQERYLLVQLLTGASPEALDAVPPPTPPAAPPTPTPQESTTPEAAEEPDDAFEWALLVNMNHALSTPLTDILGFSSILHEEGAGDVQEYARIIQQSANRLQETVRSVLDLAQLKMADFNLQLVPVDTAAYLHKALQALTPLAERRNVTIALDTADEGVWALSDRVCFSRLLHNLLNTAIHVARAGTHIGGGVQVVDGQAVVDVRCTADEAAHVVAFEAETPPIQTPVPAEAALSLVLSRQLAERTDGTFAVRQEEEDQLVFHLTLPQPKAEVMDQINAGADNGKGKKRLLVVDDNLEAQILLVHLLQNQYLVDIADNAVTALERAQAATYAAVLMDINLGEHDSGTEVMRQMRKMPVYQRIPILALTAHALPGDRERLLDEGFDEYISKPFTRQTILDALARAQVQVR